MNEPIPETMRAFVLTGHGGMEMLEYRPDWPVPDCTENQVLVRVHACGLNNTDVNTRTAWYSKEVSSNTTGGAFDEAADDDATWGGAAITFPRIQGADVAGRVAVAGSGVDATLVGKRVMIDPWFRDWNDPMNLDQCRYFGSEIDGGYADYVAVDVRQVHAIDCELADAELATFATSWVTAENMLNRANVQKGDSVLITGASGGVGSALIQLAKRRGATTIGMSSESKHEQVRAAGADHVLPRSPDNLRAALADASGRENVTVVADVVGGDDFPALIDSLARGGRYTCAGAIAGPIVELDLRTLYLRDLTFSGATITETHTFADLVSYIARGEVHPVLAATYSLRDLREAQQAFIDKSHVGNIVVTMGGA